MGWKNRRFSNHRRRNYDSYFDNPPPSPPSSPPNPGNDDDVPLWEKNFCYYIGKIPWRKVVGAKMFMSSHRNVATWNDSACIEAFQNAKNRYWAEINGLPSHAALPDQDMYIDEINWNPDIDPELIKELDLLFTSPPDDGGDNSWGHKSKKTRMLLSNHQDVHNREPDSEGCKSNAADVDNPWECHLQAEATLKDLLPGWSKWNPDTDCSVDQKNNDNPWEHGFTSRDEVAKGDIWEDAGNKLWERKQINKFDGWNNDGNCWKSTCHAEDKGWGDNHNNSYRSYNQREPRKSNNGHSYWQNNRNYNQGRGISKNRGWRDNGGQGWGSKPYNNYNKDSNHFEPKASSSGWGDWNKGFREKEGSDHRGSSGCRREVFSGDNGNDRRGNEWSRGSKKRVNFGID